MTTGEGSPGGERQEGEVDPVESVGRAVALAAIVEADQQSGKIVAEGDDLSQLAANVVELLHRSVEAVSRFQEGVFSTAFNDTVDYILDMTPTEREELLLEVLLGNPETQNRGIELATRGEVGIRETVSGGYALTGNPPVSGPASSESSRIGWVGRRYV